MLVVNIVERETTATVSPYICQLNNVKMLKHQLTFAEQVEVVDDLNQGLTQDMINGLCQSGEIGDLIEAENEKIVEHLNKIINAGSQEISFKLVSRTPHRIADASSEGTGPISQAQNCTDMQTDLRDDQTILDNDVFHSGICAFCGKCEIALQDEEEDGPAPPAATAKLQRCKGCRNRTLL